MRIFQLAQSLSLDMEFSEPARSNRFNSRAKSVFTETDAMLKSNPEMLASIAYAARYGKYKSPQDFLVATLFPEKGEFIRNKFYPNADGIMGRTWQTFGYQHNDEEIVQFDHLISRALAAASEFGNPADFIKSRTAIDLASKHDPAAFDAFAKRRRDVLSGER